MSNMKLNLNKIIARVAGRLLADSRAQFVAIADSIAHKYGLARKQTFYPKEYEAKTDPKVAEKIRKAFEALGMKFHKFAASSPNANAFRAEGDHDGVEYLVDIVQHGPYVDLEVYF